MKNDLKKILLKHRDINIAIEKIENLYADRSDLEKITVWRQKYYGLEKTNERITAKFKIANDKLIRLMKILMEK